MHNYDISNWICIRLIGISCGIMNKNKVKLLLIFSVEVFTFKWIYEYKCYIIINFILQSWIFSKFQCKHSFSYKILNKCTSIFQFVFFWCWSPCLCRWTTYKESSFFIYHNAFTTLHLHSCWWRSITWMWSSLLSNGNCFVTT